MEAQPPTHTHSRTHRYTHTHTQIHAHTYIHTHTHTLSDLCGCEVFLPSPLPPVPLLYQIDEASECLPIRA